MNTSSSKAHEAVYRARSVMPGGWLGDSNLPDTMKLVNASGKGSRITTVDGEELLDLACGGGALILGHAHPHLVEAVCQQVHKGTHFHGLNDRAVELAERIVKIVPCAESLRFASSGAEATFYALRLARAYTGKEKILKFEGAYHGHHDYGLMSVTPNSSNSWAPQPDSAGIPKAIEDLVVIAPFNDLEATAALIEEHKDDLAAVIVEPVQRSFPPKAGFLEGLRQVTRDCGVLLVFDEVVTGFRLALGGAQELFGVVPDLAAYGKALAGGYPLAAVAGPDEIMRAADPARKRNSDYVYVSGTLSGNPLCCAAANAALDELSKPGTYDYLNKIGEDFRAGLAKTFSNYGIPAQLSGIGAMFRVFFTTADKPPMSFREQGSTNNELFYELAQGLFKHGVFMSVRPKSYLSTAHSAEDLKLLLNGVKALCEAGLGKK